MRGKKSMRNRMIRIKIASLMAGLVAAVSLEGCGLFTKSYDFTEAENSIYVEDNATIRAAMISDFDKDYYSIDELAGVAQQEALSFNKNVYDCSYYSYDQMTKEEKAQYMQQKREKELTDREAAITRKELMAEAKNTLASDGLPQELAEVLDYSDADTCKKSMEKVKEVFQRAVETAVEEKLKGGKPPKKAPGGDAQKALEEQVYNIMMGNN